MKIIAGLEIYRREFADKSQFDAIAAVCPGLVKYEAIRIHLPLDNPEVQSILRLLDSYGMKPWPMRGNKAPHEYSLTHTREYDAAELDNFEYLEPYPSPTLENALAETPVDSPEQLKGDAIKRINKKERNALLENKPLFAFVRPRTIMVTDAFKELLIAAEAKRLKFEELEVAGDNPLKNKLWFLSSEVVMPPMSAKCRFVDWEGNLFTGDYSKGLMLDESENRSSEYHYTRKAIEALGTFDAAWTQESFGAHPTSNRRLIVSQKIRQICLSQKQNVIWFPVQIDPE